MSTHTGLPGTLWTGPAPACPVTAYYLALAQEGDLSVVNVSHCICPECSAMVTRIAPRFAEDHGGELCHVTPGVLFVAWTERFPQDALW